MSRYGTAIYGRSLYGQPLLGLFSAEPFTALPVDYGSVLLDWKTPGGTWDELRVVRNFTGYPVHVNNGSLLYSAIPTEDPGHLTDEGLPTDRWVYYTIFVHDPGVDEWARAGVARTFIPSDYGGAARMLDLFPQIVRSDALTKFTSVLGYAYDLLRNDINSLLDLYDSRAVSYDLLPGIMAQFGIPFETELEPEQYRRFARNAVFFYKMKGTLPCIHGVVAAVTGWQCTVLMGTNMLWTADYSDFVGGIGGWEELTNATVEWVAPTDTTPGALRLNAVANGATAEAHLGERLPVRPFGTYSVGIQSSAEQASETNASIRFDWYAADGTLVGSAESPVSVIREGAKQLRATEDAPATAAWLDVVLVMHGVLAGQSWLWRQASVNHGSEAPYQSGRDLRIYLAITDTDPIRRAVHLDRLNAILPRYLPLGATFTLLDEAPPYPYVNDDSILVQSE